LIAAAAAARTPRLQDFIKDTPFTASLASSSSFMMGHKQKHERNG